MSYYRPASSSIVEAFNDREIIKNIFVGFLNYKGERFNIAEIENMDAFDPNNYVYNEQVQGAIQFNSISMSSINDGGETKEVIIRLMIPVGEQNEEDNKLVATALKSINEKQFVSDDDLSITITNASISNSQLLSRAINGIEYESVNIVFTAISTMNYMNANVEYIEIDNSRLNGVYNILYACRKTTDAIIKGGNPIQKNEVNGIQVSLVVDCLLYKKDSLHKKLLDEMESIKSYSVKYFNGYGTSPKTYSMLITDCNVSAIMGDTIKCKLTFSTSN